MKENIKGCDCTHLCSSDCRREGCNCECGEYHCASEEDVKEAHSEELA